MIRFSIDTLLTILRAEIDIRRFFRLPHSDFSYASWLVADSIGDKLYEALGRLDYYCSLNVEGRASMQNGIVQDTTTFRRVNSLYTQMAGISEATSTTAHGMNEFWKLGNLQGEHSGIESLNPPLVYFRQWVFVLQPFKIIKLAKYKQICLALSCLKGNPSRAEFFKAVWGSQKYAPHLHDGLISALCYRIKKIAGIVVSNESSKMTLLNALILG